MNGEVMREGNVSFVPSLDPEERGRSDGTRGKVKRSYLAELAAVDKKRSVLRLLRAKRAGVWKRKVS